MTAQAGKGAAVITGVTQRVRMIGTVRCVTTVALLLLTVAAYFTLGSASAPFRVLLVLAKLSLVVLALFAPRALSASRRPTPRTAVASSEDDCLVTYEVMAQTLSPDTRKAIETAVRWEGKPHGTVSARIKHLREGEPVCDPCFRAWEDAAGESGAAWREAPRGWWDRPDPPRGY